MPIWGWVALGVFVLLVVPSLALLVVRVVGLYRRAVAFEDNVARPAERLSLALEELDRRSLALSQRAGDVEARLASLNASLERMGVLSWALADTRSAYSWFQALKKK